MKYTENQINNFKDFLSLWVSDFGGDEEIARDLIEKEDWSEVEVMMARGEQV